MLNDKSNNSKCAPPETPGVESVISEEERARLLSELVFLDTILRGQRAHVDAMLKLIEQAKLAYIQSVVTYDNTCAQLNQIRAHLGLKPMVQMDQQEVARARADLEQEPDIFGDGGF